jgi:glycosyltransferase involved in cell wall biosynthesis
MFSDKKIAIVYDWIDKWGGVERVLLNLHEIFPNAVFYTSYFDREKAEWAKDLNIKTSFLQSFPSMIKKNRILSLPFFPFVFESFNFAGYDLVISITSSFAKSAVTQPGTKHICYLLTPTRYLWSHKKDYLKNKFISYLIGGYLDYFKNWDKITAQRPDKIISISETVRTRCQKYYGRDSEVVYPGFDMKYWNEIKLKIKSEKLRMELKTKYKIPDTKYFLIVSRLEPYKKIDLAINVFNKLNKKLIIVGKGSRSDELKQLAGDNITFLSGLSDVELGDLYSNAQALIMPQEEDFGYIALEAQFFGCPVIAYKKGGAKETIIDGKTGIFFTDQTGQSLKRAVERFDKIKYNLRKNTAKFGIINIDKFSKEKFIEKFVKNI